MTRFLVSFVGRVALAGALGITAAADVQAQMYARYGGPVYGGPVGGGPAGSSYFLGAYAPSFYVGPMPGSYGASPSGVGAGASFIPNYTSSYPFFGSSGFGQLAGSSAGGYATVFSTTFLPPISGAQANPVMINTYPTTPTPSQGQTGTVPALPALPERPRPSRGGARFEVKVPANAKLWVDYQPTNQTGPVRVFRTPATLQPGKMYEYVFHAEWDRNGQAVARDRAVQFDLGADKVVDFTQDAAR